MAFVSQSAVDLAVGDRIGLTKPLAAVTGCRSLTKKDMVLNDHTPDITVHPETFEVVADGELLRCDPVDKVPLGQRFFLF